MEQRINALEEELKVLKSQIKAVLLDIKEYLAGGNGDFVQVPVIDGSRPVAAAENGPAAGTEPAGKAAGEPVLRGNLPSNLTKLAGIEGGDSKSMDLLTISVLAQWLSRAMREISRDQISKLVEIYDVTGNLPGRLKDTLLLLVELCADSGQPLRENTAISASTGIQLLIELDSLLRYRNSALESLVLSMLVEGEPADGKGNNG
jgi:hypothetical protein